jgi:hypothetical protein
MVWTISRHYYYTRAGEFDDIYSSNNSEWGNMGFNLDTQWEEPGVDEFYDSYYLGVNLFEDDID